MIILLSATDMKPPAIGKRRSPWAVSTLTSWRQLGQQGGVVGQDADVALHRPGEDEGRLAGEELLVRRDHVDLHRHAETPQPDSESRLAFSIAWSMPPTM